MTDYDGVRTKVEFALALLLLLFLSGVGFGASNQVAEPYKFFRDYVGLNDDEIAAIRRGKAIAKIMDSRTPDEVFVFGSVYIGAPPENYLKLASDRPLRDPVTSRVHGRISEGGELVCPRHGGPSKSCSTANGTRGSHAVHPGRERGSWYLSR